MNLDPETCYRAVCARDSRFDGRFFTCVTTTKIYCRPICPARPPYLKNCQFLPSAAAAAEAGFRPCLRCRPELSPDVAAWKGTQSTISRAMALIAEGALDDENGVVALAERVGMGERQLRRLFLQHLGASPLAVAQTRRLLFAKQLIVETQLSMSDVALASGFGSIRRFNAVFQNLYGRAPSSLRPKKEQKRAATDTPAGISLRLGYRPPYDWDAMLAYLSARSIPGIEVVGNDSYARTLETEAGPGTVEVRPGKNALLITLRIPSVKALPTLVARLRRAFDLDADVQTIEMHLSKDSELAVLVSARPGLRAPAGWDPFEQSVRAILGQQIAVSAARKLAGALVTLAGTRIDSAASLDPRLSHCFPLPSHLLAADLNKIGMPESRRGALRSLAVAAQNPQLFGSEKSLEDAVARLRQIKGIGEWTAQYVALRALGHADAFPAGDLVLQQNASFGCSKRGTSKRISEKELLARAEVWRPWRAYAAQHLWTSNAPMADQKGDAAP